MREIIMSVDRDVHLAIDSDEDARGQVIAEVEALSSYDLCRPGMDGHEDCDADDPCCDMDEWPSLRDVGEAVATWLQDKIDRRVDDDVLKILFVDLLDLNSSAMLEELGRTWYPADAMKARKDAGYPV